MMGSLNSTVQVAFRYSESRKRTILTHRRAGGLCHLGKPYWTGEVLGLQLVNPTAGLFSGDTLSLQVNVGSRSRVALTSPSATRFHTMEKGCALLHQGFNVGEEAWLDFWPEMVIPQRDSEVWQTTGIDLAPGASMVFLDLLAPGRVAHGERYAYRRFESSFSLYQSGTLVARERCLLEPARDAWPLKMPGWDLCYYGALWVAGPATETAVKRVARVSPGDSGIQWGASLLEKGLGVIRVVARSSLLIRKTTSKLRNLLQEDFPLLSTDFRKL